MVSDSPEAQPQPSTEAAAPVPGAASELSSSVLGNLLGVGGGPETPLAHLWQPPEVEELRRALPQYEIECFLSRGAMGAVYRGRQAALNRTVAIKILSPLLRDADPQLLERFRQEAQIMARLNHPAIVTIFEAGETATGIPFLVMEHVEGLDLARVMAAEKRLPPRRALEIVRTVCSALAAAHAADVLHRDIKPSNIMLDAEGHALVTDFGIAKLLSATGGEGLTSVNMVVGTPEFMAPELRDPAVKPDGRADLYSLGVMLYHLVTGRLPHGRYTPVSILVPGADPRIDGILENALEAEPERRYPAATAMLRDLETALSPPPGLSRRSRLLVYSAGALLVALTVLGLTPGPWQPAAGLFSSQTGVEAAGRVSADGRPQPIPSLSSYGQKSPLLAVLPPEPQPLPAKALAAPASEGWRPVMRDFPDIYPAMNLRGVGSARQQVKKGFFPIVHTANAALRMRGAGRLTLLARWSAKTQDGLHGFRAHLGMVDPRADKFFTGWVNRINYDSRGILSPVAYTYYPPAGVEHIAHLPEWLRPQNTECEVELQSFGSTLRVWINGHLSQEYKGVRLPGQWLAVQSSSPLEFSLLEWRPLSETGEALAGAAAESAAQAALAETALARGNPSLETEAARPAAYGKAEPGSGPPPPAGQVQRPAWNRPFPRVQDLPEGASRDGFMQDGPWFLPVHDMAMAELCPPGSRNQGLRAVFRRNRPGEFLGIFRIRDQAVPGGGPGSCYLVSLAASGQEIWVQEAQAYTNSQGRTDMRWQRLQVVPLPDPPAVGAQFGLEAVIVNKALFVRYNGRPVARVEVHLVDSGRFSINAGEAFRDLEHINLDGLTEAEAMTRAGVDADNWDKSVAVDLTAPLPQLGAFPPLPRPSPPDQEGWVKVWKLDGSALSPEDPETQIPNPPVPLTGLVLNTTLDQSEPAFPSVFGLDQNGQLLPWGKLPFAFEPITGRQPPVVTRLAVNRALAAGVDTNGRVHFWPPSPNPHLRTLLNSTWVVAKPAPTGNYYLSRRGFLLFGNTHAVKAADCPPGVQGLCTRLLATDDCRLLGATTAGERLIVWPPDNSSAPLVLNEVQSVSEAGMALVVTFKDRSRTLLGGPAGNAGQRHPPGLERVWSTPQLTLARIQGRWQALHGAEQVNLHRFNAEAEDCFYVIFNRRYAFGLKRTP